MQKKNGAFDYLITQKMLNFRRFVRFSDKENKDCKKSLRRQFLNIYKIFCINNSFIESVRPLIWTINIMSKLEDIITNIS